MNPEKYQAVLAVHPTARGMGWVIATSPLTLIDWGIIRAKGDKNATCLRRITALIETFSPAVIVIRHAAGSSRKRIKRIQRLVTAVVQLARTRNIEIQLSAEKQVRSHFERFGARTREEIAQFLASNIDALSSRVPPKRRPWMSEDARLGLFDAAALAVAFFIERDLMENPFADHAAS
jgi:hypothetical protein